jgi:hypothetical protein
VEVLNLWRRSLLRLYNNFASPSGSGNAPHFFGFFRRGWTRINADGVLERGEMRGYLCMKKTTTMRDNLIYLAVAGVVVCLAYFFVEAPGINRERADLTLRIFLVAMIVAGILYGSISMHKAEVRKVSFWAVLLAMLGCYTFFKWHQIVSKKSKPSFFTTLLEIFLFAVVFEFVLLLLRRQSDQETSG